MNSHFYKHLPFLSAIILSISCSPKINTGRTAQINRWEQFDPSSITSATEITKDQLQGLWKAYEGEIKYEGNENTMHLYKPIIIEIKDSLARRALSVPLTKFQLKQNIIIVQVEAPRLDTGIINKITSKELTITWRNHANYTRYYYTK